MTDAARILVVRLSSLGDVILATPVFEALKQTRPRCHTSVLVKKSFAGVFQGNSHVDEVLVFEDKGFWGWLAEIRRRKFDLYVDLHDTPRSRLWGFFSGARERRRYDKQALARRFLVWFKKTSPVLDKNVPARYLACIGSDGIASRPRLYGGNGPETASRWERRLGAGPWIVVAPGAAHATKQWPAQRFAAAADALADAWRKPVVLVGSVQDGPVIEEVLRHLRAPAQSVAGETSLEDLMFILRRAAVLLTNDSGAMHAGAALGAPTVAFFGPTVRAFGFFPAGAAVLERQGLYCRPCSLHGTDRCPEKHFRCMREISVEDAVAAALRIGLRA